MKVKYAHKLIDNEKEIKDIPLATFEEKDIIEEVLQLLKSNESFRCSQVFGDARIGKPIEYEKLVLIDAGGEKVFEYFNKGIHYMLQNSESARQVFQVFTFFMVRERKK